MCVGAKLPVTSVYAYGVIANFVMLAEQATLVEQISHVYRVHVCNVCAVLLGDHSDQWPSDAVEEHGTKLTIINHVRCIWCALDAVAMCLARFGHSCTFRIIKAFKSNTSV